LCFSFCQSIDTKGGLAALAAQAANVRARLILVSVLALTVIGATGPPHDRSVPRYNHIFVIIEENKSSKIIGSADAPYLSFLARTYGFASNSYAVTHPSEPNYVAIVGGNTFGILDDDAYYCTHNDKRPYCSFSWVPFFPDHTIDRPNIGTQLRAARLSWKEYLESLPAPGSLAVVAPDPKDPNGPLVFAAKHSGFINFTDVQNSPQRSLELVDFGQLDRDIAQNELPNLAVIIPNLCNDMHGVDDNAPADCQSDNVSGLIKRGDAHAKTLVDAILATKSWRSGDRDAIVITFDEDDHRGREGCCGVDPSDPANAGGGRIPTIVVTNHGPRALVDPTPYSHYSLLRTIEDAFGITTYLGRADAPGVVPMVKLFQDAR
jgi:phosphatidylinositol-3-phosphatase